MEKTIDCIVCGTCTVDIMVKPFPVDSAIGGGKLVRVDPIEATTGGIVSNSGMTLARLGMRVTAFTYVGDDEWAPIVKSKHQAEGIGMAREHEDVRSCDVGRQLLAVEGAGEHCVRVSGSQRGQGRNDAGTP